MKKQTRNILVIIGLSALVFIYMLKTDGAANLWSALRSARPAWLIAACGLMAAYWLLESQILHLAVQKFHPGQKFACTLQTSMIGQLFNCITPFASGGQPVQAYHLVKSGVPFGTASCALMIKFIVYQSVLTLYSLITLLLRYKMFSAQVRGLGLLVLLGFGVNAAVIAGLLSLCCFPKATRRFLLWGVQVLTKLRVLKDPDRAREQLGKRARRFL